MHDHLDYLIDHMPPEGHPWRDEWEDKIADEMWHARLDRYRGWTVRLLARVRVRPGREADARRWVEDVLGQPWPRKRVERELGRMVAPLYERGDEPPRDLFDVDLIARLREGARLETRDYPAYP